MQTCTRRPREASLLRRVRGLRLRVAQAKALARQTQAVRETVLPQNPEVLLNLQLQAARPRAHQLTPPRISKVFRRVQTGVRTLRPPLTLSFPGLMRVWRNLFASAARLGQADRDGLFRIRYRLTAAAALQCTLVHFVQFALHLFACRR